jgi:DNA polymerase I-like protein with 3'-5' exonuclease and polymerase domains
VTHNFDRDVSWEIVTTGDRLEQVAREIQAQRRFCWDTETSGRAIWFGSRIVGHSFAWRPSEGKPRACYIPCRHKPLETELFQDMQQLAPEVVARVLKPILEGPQVKVGHNLRFDMHHAAADGILVAPPFADTIVACKLIDERWWSYALDACVRHSKIPCESDWKQQLKPQIADKAKRMGGSPKAWVAKYGYQYLTIPVVGRYAAQDATYNLWLAEWAVPQQRAWGRIWNMEMALLQVLVDMERIGVPIDQSVLVEIADREKSHMADLAPRIYGLANCEWELTNDNATRKVLFGKLGYESAGKTPGGDPSVDDDALWNLETQGKEIAKLLRQWNVCQKIVSTYTLAIVEQCDPHGILHTEIDQMGAKTGRVSSRNPNLQNIPIRTELGRQVRRAFIARPGKIRACLDYCLPGDTEIITADGVKPIRDVVSEGGKVLACSPEGELGFKIVERGARIGVKPVVEVVLSGGETVRCTADHEWMALHGQKVKARDLKPGDRLRHVRQGRSGDYHGNNYRVVSVREAGEEEVFHLTVADWHTFVLANGLVSFNSQIELRMIAHLTQDPLLLKIYRENLDAHSISALEAFGTDQVVNGVDMRRIGKILNFGTSFGMTADGLLGNTNKDLPKGAVPVTRAQAEQFVAQFHAKYKGVQQYKNYLCYQVSAAGGQFRDLFGRPRHMGDGYAIGAPGWKRRAEERATMASMVQGSTASLVKFSMVAVWRYMREQQICEADMVLMIHDDCQFDLGVGHEKLIPELKRVMEQTCQANLSVPIKCDVEWFDTHWGDKKKLK